MGVIIQIILKDPEAITYALRKYAADHGLNSHEEGIDVIERLAVCLRSDYPSPIIKMEYLR